ncbi:MAG: CHC2 zinc finger domain-containing protein, partial [Sulfuritalea sp.]|nr:CHC2 zinc finger domain-containing protein [Sulfuritalea sp.]
MARIPEAEIERLKNEVSVERLIEASGIELKKAGKDKQGRCPFHEDDTASLVVTPAKNLWHCFGCGVGGGPIDWTMKRQGVSFRHAIELLKADSSLAAEPVATHGGAVKRSTVRALPAPVALDADDRTLLGQVIDYYAATLKQSPEALAYLESRGLTGAAVAEAIDTFKLGYANRSLGLRLPAKSRVAGAELRTRLQKIGIYRESGHEHFNGSLVMPILDAAGNVVEVYGRKVRDDLRAGTPAHLYLPGPHAGVWNREALTCEEVIVCEALIDALTFWCAGFRNVTSAYGVEGVTDELVEAIQAAGIRRVLIAFDRDEAGERGAAKLAERLLALGIDCFRVVFPKGMDANAYAQKVKPAAKSLGLLIRKAEWMGQGVAPKREHAEPEVVTERDHLPPPAPSLAAAAATEQAAKEETPALPAAAVPPAPTSDAAAQVSEREIVLTFGDDKDARRWRVRGLPKNLAVGVLKVNLMVSDDEGKFHVDTLDLYAARARAVFLQQAAGELGVNEGMLKTDLGRVLLKLEALQDEAIRAALAPKEAPAVQMTDAERAEALALLQSPDLLARIVADFDACGVVGETTNKQVAYLAAISRLLERPLAIVIQSSSAAGKSSLMDAVLAFVPEEARTQYSAMTGQSLFYMGQTNLKHKILAIAEEAGASRASYALKLLQSEGELTIASTGSDPDTGNLVTQEYRVEGPTMLMMTTTAIDLDEELLNRCLVLSVDEDREQTRRIHALQRERRTLAGLTKREAKTAILTTHKNAQRLLRPLAVVNPYADRLTFLDDRTRTRRDHDKYLTLIDTIALLHQHQRAIKTATVHGRTVEYIEATLTDIETANRIAHEVLGRSLDELPPQTRRVLGLIVAHVAERAQAGALRRADVRFTRGELRAGTGWGDTQLKLHLARLAELEYLLVHRAERGQGYVYELLYDGDAATPMHLSGLIDTEALKSHAYDDQRSGSAAERSAPGRGVVGGQSGPGRGAASFVDAHPVGVS